MKLYIAGPMSNVPDFNYPAFHAATKQLAAVGYTPINPARSEGREGCATWLHYMRAALRDIADADGIATLPGWVESRGARLEVHLADDLGIPVRPVDEWYASAYLVDRVKGLGGVVS